MAKTTVNNTRAIAAKKTAAKKTATITGDVLVIAEKNGETITYHNAAADAPISPVEVQSSLNVQSALCFNLLAGNMHGEILEAAGKRGGIRRLFPSMANADHAALKACLASNPETLRNGWAGHCAKTKRVRGITLQALAKSIRVKDPDDAGKQKSIRERLVETWEAFAEANPKLANDVALKPLFDLYNDALPTKAV